MTLSVCKIDKTVVHLLSDMHGSPIYHLPVVMPTTSAMIGDKQGGSGDDQGNCFYGDNGEDGNNHTNNC